MFIYSSIAISFFLHKYKLLIDLNVLVSWKANDVHVHAQNSCSIFQAVLSMETVVHVLKIVS